MIAYNKSAILSSKELKLQAITILLSSKYEKLNGLACAESVHKQTYKKKLRKIKK